MKRYTIYISLILLTIIAGMVNLRASVNSGFIPGAGGGEMSFIENRGQVTDSAGRQAVEVLYYARSGSTTVYFTRNSVIYVQSSAHGNIENYSRLPRSINDDNYYSVASDGISRIDMQIAGAAPGCTVTGIEPAAGVYNYYLPSCPGGIINVKSFQKILYTDIYNNIDLVFYNSPDGSGLKYDFIVRPGGEVSNIRLMYKGNSSLKILGSGRLSAGNMLASISEAAPYAYLAAKTGMSLQGNKNQSVGCRFRLRGDTACFSTGKYDKTRTLVIDPQILWSTYYGGSNSDHAYSITVDRENNIVVIGYTLSDSLPVTPGAFQQKKDRDFDLFITKFDSSGKHLWTTYYGGSQADYGLSVSTDPSSDIFVTGWTFSHNFPVSVGAFQGAFGGNENDGLIVKLTKNGQRAWATYYGGEGNEHAYGIAADSSGCAAITGWTLSAALPVDSLGFQAHNAGLEDAFVARFSGNGAFLWGTYFGGDSTDYGQGLSVDTGGNIIIAGYTGSHDMPVKGNAFQIRLNRATDAFVAKFDSTGSLLYSSYFGGENHDYANAVTTDAASNIIVAGYTLSSSLPIVGKALQPVLAGRSDAMLFKMNSSGSVLFSTYLGGNSEDMANAVCVDKDRNIVVTGQTESRNFPVTPGTFQPSLSGVMDAFVSKFSSDGRSLEWSSYLGGGKNDWGLGASTGALSSIYLCGDSESDDFYTTANAHKPGNSGMIDGFIIRLCASAPHPLITANGPLIFCPGDSVTLDAGAGYNYYKWSNGLSTRKITVGLPGDYSVYVRDSNYCDGTSSSVTVSNYPGPLPQVSGKTQFCKGDSSVIAVTGDFVSYEWSGGQKTKSITVSKSGRYVVTVTDTNGCQGRDTVDVTVFPLPQTHISGPKTVCAFSNGIVYFVTDSYGHSYSWSIQGGLIRQGDKSPMIMVDWSAGGSGKIIVEEMVDKTGCTAYDTIMVNISDKLEPQISSDKNVFEICQGDSLTLDAGSGYFSYLWSDGKTSQTLVVKSGGQYSVTVRDEGGCLGRDTVVVAVHPVPQPLIQGDSVVCVMSKGNVYQTADIPGHAYSWLVRGGNVSGRSDQSRILVDWTDTGSAEITLVETIEATGCYSTARTLVVRVMPLPDIEMKHEGELEFCQGDSVTLDAGSGFASYAWSNGESGRKITVKSSGSYKVTVMSEYACTNSDSVYVMVYPNPAVPLITESNDTLIAGPAYAYQWSRNGIPITGAGNRTFSPVSEGTYTVTVFNEHYCSSVSEAYNFSFRVARAELSLPADTIWAESGKQVLVPVVITESFNLNRVGARSFILYLRFNGSMLAPADNGYNIISDSTDRIIILSGVRTDTVGKIAELLFNTALGVVPCSGITIDSVAWREAPVNTTVKNTVFCLSDLCRAGGTRLIDSGRRLSFEPVYPNPFSGLTTFEFEVIEDADTRILIMDPLGKTLMTAYQTSKAGSYKINFDGSILPTGIYFAVLQTPTQRLIRKMEVVR